MKLKDKIIYLVENREGERWYSFKEADNYYERNVRKMTLEAFIRLETQSKEAELYRRVLKEIIYKK